MSIHKSLVAKGRLKRHRNVLSRVERIAALEQEEKWTPENDSIFNLPKVRVAKLKRATKKKEVKEGEEGAEVATAGTATGPVAKAAAPAPKAAAKDSKPAKK